MELHIHLASLKICFNICLETTLRFSASSQTLTCLIEAIQEGTAEASSSTIENPSADAIMFPHIQPLCDSGLVAPDNQEQTDHGPGIYAIPVLPFVEQMTGFSTGNLIPLKYNVPTGPDPAGGANRDTDQEVQQQQHAPHGQVVVRRFQFAVQIDLMLIFKLAAVVFLFNQEGSRQRLVLLILFASIIYLYQTGAFAPLLRWLRQAGTPPVPQAPLRQENPLPAAQDRANDLLPGRGGGRQRNGVDWRGIVNEIRMLVTSFLTSLFPGFHLHND
ncbi:unnamed protein product [Spirodela intermedia]|uniref:Uncharacterized protein n=1 Tax=Spirodela intermedia TaxID=51605 RepID=A0A7I8J2D7_SPIIN|nr:unnamed protein product [Spirodela intermedia]CAA6663480.1 unnamed protein product [Spirodela intermedia]